MGGTSADSCHAVDEHLVVFSRLQVGVDAVSQSIEVVPDRCRGKVENVVFLHANALRIGNDDGFERDILWRNKRMSNDRHVEYARRTTM